MKVIFKKKIIAAIISALAIFSAVFWGRGFYDYLKPADRSISDFPRPIAHFYKNPVQSIGKIRLKLFYVIPKNQSAEVFKNWRETIKAILDEAVKFHKFQFRGSSVLHYDIWPIPIILEKNNDFYDTESTNKGNPSALKTIFDEIKRRAFESGGDIFNNDFAVFGKEEYPAYGFIYEGKGASGLALEKEGAFILARAFIAQKQYASFRSSLLYHELGHTFGLPDQYDVENNDVFSNDIMGAGRKKPIEVNYLDRQLLKGLGVIF